MAQQFSLDARLLQAATYVREGAVFADIGCDHGYLSIYLITHRKAINGYACDISYPSVCKATKNIALRGLEGEIFTRHTSGLQGLEDCGITDVIIAGMGGEMISQILEQADFLYSPKIRLSLQPMSREAHLRYFLAKKGFQSLEETAVHSGGFVYTVLCAEFNGQSRQITPLEAHTGLLLWQTTPQARDKLNRTAKYLEDMSSGLLFTDREAESLQLAQVSAEIRHILSD